MRAEGQTHELYVGFSESMGNEHDDHKIYVFNGNHRLLAAQRLGIEEMMCDNAQGADDAIALTLEQITKLGGRLLP